MPSTSLNTFPGRSADLIALVPDAAIELDAAGTIVAVNDLALAVLGCERDAVVGAPVRSWLPLGPGLDGDEERFSARLTLRRSNGVPVVVDVTAKRIADGGGGRWLCLIRELSSGSLVHESQRYFDVAFDDSPIGMALFNPDGEYIRVNRALCELLGRTPEQLIGTRDQELTHPEDRAADVEAAWEILEGRLNTHQCEKRFLRPDGSVVWALANLTFLRDGDGRPLSWVGQFQDITARRAAEEALRESEERHRLVVRNLPGAGVALYDRRLRCVLSEGRPIGGGAEGTSGHVGRFMHELVEPSLLAELEPAARRALVGVPSEVEAVSSSSGRALAAEVVPHRTAGGDIAGVLVCVRDVTQERASEQAVREAEERFRLAFDHAPIGLALVSPEGRWLRVNQRLCTMIGYDEADLLSSSFQDITHPDDLDADLEHVRALLAGEMQAYEMDKRYVRRDGSVIWISLSVSLVRDVEGTPLYFISQIQDIDQRKRAHGELERLARQDALTATLNRRAWDERLAHAVSEAARTRRPLGIALMDLNGFKQVNDSLGHEAGDRLLRRSAEAWQKQLRGSDALARIGGDEFGVLLPDCDVDELAAVAQRLQRALDHGPGCAIGVARWIAGESPEELLRRADAALYGEKRARAA